MPRRFLRSGVVLALLLVGCHSAPSDRAPTPAMTASARVFSEVPGSDSRIRIEGRAAASDQGPRFAWPGTRVHIRFEGTALHVRLAEAPFGDAIRDRDTIGVSVDGAPLAQFSLAPGEHVYRVAEGLPRAMHDVVIVKLTETEQGTVTLRSVASDGPLAQAAPAQPRRMLAIGDSITAGYGIDGPPGCHYDARFANAARAWFSLAADALGAERHVIAWSGRGLVWNYDRRLEPTMATLARLSIGGEPDALHDPTSFVPDAVVVNLGTNDTSRPEYESGAFALAYLELLATLRESYPSARVVVAYGPLLSDDYPQPGSGTLRHMRATLEGMVAQRRQLGDTNVVLLELPSAQGREGVGCDAHPSARTHERLSLLLVEALADVW